MNNNRVKCEQQAHEKSQSKVWRARLWTGVKWAIRLFKFVYFLVNLAEGGDE